MQHTKLWNKDFLLVVIGQIISLFGNAILRFALPLYLLRETGSAALFGLVTATSFLPMIVLSFMGGILADRVNKRNIMVILDFATAGIILLLYVLLGMLPLVPLCMVALMLLYGISGAYQPAVQASIPVLAPPDSILTASAVINQISSLSGLLGPLIGGALFGSFGIVPVLLISAVCFAFSAIMEIFIVIPFTKRQDSRSMVAIAKGDLQESLTYIQKEKPSLFRIVWIVCLFNLVLSAMMVVGVPVILVDIFQVNDNMLGLAQALAGLGGLCGGIATALFSKRLKLQKAHLLLLICGVLTAGMALPLLLQLPNFTGYVVITALQFVMMACATMFSVQMMATVQSQTPPHLVGKVLALMISLAMCAQPLGQALYGFAFEQFSNHISLILLAAGVLSALIATSSRTVFRKL